MFLKINIGSLLQIKYTFCSHQRQKKSPKCKDSIRIKVYGLETIFRGEGWSCSAFPAAQLRHHATTSSLQPARAIVSFTIKDNPASHSQ